MNLDDENVNNSGIEPTLNAADDGKFKIKIMFNGILQGWWTDNGSPEWWITTVPTSEDASTWHQVPYNNLTYLSTGTDNYLGYRHGNVIYSTCLKKKNWGNATAWKLEGTHLRADNGNLVGIDGGSYYCNNQNVVDVYYVPLNQL